MEIATLTTTLKSQEDAQVLAALVIEGRHAACAQISGPVQSVFCWNGEICHEQEVQLLLKTSVEHRETLIEFVRDKHPYDTPQIITVQETSSEDYGAWLKSQVG